jgi:hypothetical protein
VKSRTIVRRRKRDDPYGHYERELEAAPFELCIAELKGNGQTHIHDYGHDFPMSRQELNDLEAQISYCLGRPR